MARIASELCDGVLVATMDHGVTNPINLELVRELDGVLARARTDPAVRALVLTSANQKFFSIGLDLPTLYPLASEAFREFFREFQRVCLDLFTFPKPVVAAITGHATAGGCILALCCDYRFIGQGRKLIGLNEAKLGLPVPYFAYRCLRELIGAGQARRLTESGDFCNADEAVRLGMVDEAVPDAELQTRAMEQAQQLGALPPDVYALNKSNRIEGIEAEVKAKWQAQEDAFLACWHSPEARKRLQAAIEKF